jgi:hypothetical protein
MNPSPVGPDSRSAVGRYMNHALAEGDPGEALAVLLRELTEALSMIFGGLSDWRARGRRR